MSTLAATEQDSTEVAPPLGAGRYRLRDILGQGATATVYRAWDDELGEECAVKVLSAAARTDRVLLARFEREARLLGQVEHPALIRVRASGLNGGVPYLVLELAPGGSLRDRMIGGARSLGQEGMAPEAVLRLLLPVLEALQVVHEAGIVHRDVKPENILIGEEGQPLLADFGVAQLDLEATLTAAGDRLGSFAYMAPEQLDGTQSVGPAADLYAVGATILALTLGRPPFGLLEPLRREALLAALPLSLRPVVARATAARPEDRPPSAAVLAAELRAVLRLRDGTSTPSTEAAALQPPPTAPPDRPVSSRPRWRPGPRSAVGIGLSLLILFAGGFLPGGSSVPEGAPEPPSPPTSPALEAASSGSAAPPTAPLARAEVAAVTATNPLPVATEELPPPRISSPDPSKNAPSTGAASTAAEPASPPSTGTLAVNSRPWSEVTIDGKPQRRSPWVGPLSAGSHQLHLQTADGRELSRSITLEPGGSIELCWDFSTEAPCDR